MTMSFRFSIVTAVDIYVCVCVCVYVGVRESGVACSGSSDSSQC